MPSMSRARTPTRASSALVRLHRRRAAARCRPQGTDASRGRARRDRASATMAETTSSSPSFCPSSSASGRCLAAAQRAQFRLKLRLLDRAGRRRRRRTRGHVRAAPRRSRAGAARRAGARRRAGRARRVAPSSTRACSGSTIYGPFTSASEAGTDDELEHPRRRRAARGTASATRSSPMCAGSPPTRRSGQRRAAGAAPPEPPLAAGPPGACDQALPALRAARDPEQRPDPGVASAVVPRRRRQASGLERVLGAPALFATAYGNVGSSIYYALGLTPASRSA